ncbi:unnamed protein product [Blumeria hordei]|uniref:Uncharacterized protein n=1 Tax=Blumeria hordei TaxID=2867405 RepID=A0A383UZU4_BLUHO|nr:unnamed protein product [Blumeria hordei]
MHRIHSLLLAALFFIVFAAADERTFRCGTKVEFEEALINKKLAEMQRYYVSSFRACRFKKLCIRKRLRRLLWRRRNYKGSLDNTNSPNSQNSMALWLPIRRSGERRRRIPWRKRNTYQVVATCTNQTTCKLLSVTERTGGKKSTETACTEIYTQNTLKPSFSRLFTIREPPEGASKPALSHPNDSPGVAKRSGGELQKVSGLMVEADLPTGANSGNQIRTFRQIFKHPVGRSPL